jgi:hypothetical protein
LRARRARNLGFEARQLLAFGEQLSGLIPKWELLASNIYPEIASIICSNNKQGLRIIAIGGV